MSPLPWPLTGNRFFFLFVFLNFSGFLIILLFYKLYIAIINHKQFLCLARKNDSLMILQYSYILIIIFIIKQWKEMQEKKQGNDGHLQHVMASLVIMYNLWFDFFLFLMCHTDLSQSGDVVAQSEKKHQLAISNSH